MTASNDSPERRSPSIDDFLGEPTRDLADWEWLWKGDHAFPIRTHRGPLGRLVVAFKRLFRPLVRTPQNDLWERQQIFNLILIEHLGRNDEGQRLVHALIWLERESQKKIVIGKAGSVLKQAGTLARQELRELLGERVHLELWVKVREHWADNERELQRVGFEV